MIEKNNLKAWLYLLPALAFMIIFMVYPLVDVFVYSFEEGYNFVSQRSSGIGFYNGQEIFIYDIIGIDELKNHLRQIVPSIICFYSIDNANNFSFTYPTFMGGVCTNDSKIFHHCEKFSLGKTVLIKKILK